jgi:hypothetical protein
MEKDAVQDPTLRCQDLPWEQEYVEKRRRNLENSGSVRAR